MIRKKDAVLLGVFLALLVALVVFSKQILFHDTVEYFNIVKTFAGFEVIKSHSTHSMVYTVGLAPFVKLIPSLLTIKVLNVVWLFLTALVLVLNGYRKAFFLFIFSPMVWTSAPQLTPVLPAAFFTTVAYLEWEKWKKDRKKKQFIFTALSLGFAMALYSPMWLVAVLFIISFMRETKIHEMIYFTILAGIAYLPRLIIDWKLTHFPFYSEIRFFGANLKNALGVGATGNAGIVAGLFESGTIYFVVLISPLLFMLLKTNFRKYKNELFFIITTTAFFLVTGSYVKYVLIPGAIIFILLSKVLNRKLAYTHAVLSIVVTIIFIIPFFTPVEAMIPGDLESIQQDYNIEGAIMYQSIAIYLWEGNLYLPEEYEGYINNEPYFSQLSFRSKPTFYYDKILEIQGNILIAMDPGVADSTLWIAANDDKTIPVEFVKENCYDYLCVYKKDTATA